MVRGGGHDPDAPWVAKNPISAWDLVSPVLPTLPFRRHKTWVHEGGISTPLIAHWPDGIKAKGELRHSPGHVIDIVPTILELAGVEKPKSWKGDPFQRHPVKVWFHPSPRIDHPERIYLVDARGQPCDQARQFQACCRKGRPLGII